MIALHVKFSTEEALSLFRDAGLRVEEVYSFENVDRENRGIEVVFVKKWKVENPHTGGMEDLETAFRRYLDGRRSRLFLEADRLEIYNLFNRK